MPRAQVRSGQKTGSSIVFALKRAAARAKPRRRARDREARLIADALVELASASARAAATGATVEVRVADPHAAKLFETALRLSALRRPTDRLIRLRSD